MGTVVRIESARDRLVARQYVDDWIQYGCVTALLRMDGQFSQRVQELIRLEFKKRGIDW